MGKPAEWHNGGMGTRFDAVFLLGVAAMFQAVMYSVVTFIVLLTEKLSHIRKETTSLNEAFFEMWSHQDRNIIFAKILCIGLVFLIYHLYREIDRRLGEGAPLRMVFSRS